MNTDLTIYERAPLRVQHDIPVFSHTDEYIENYMKISHDHVKVFERDGTNPFIPEELWVESESATRALLGPYLPERGTLLDVGVGMGRTIAPLERMTKHGMDISFEYLKIARSKNIEVCFSRIEDMPYRKDFFDVIVCTDVLEHVMDLNECCRNILSVLKPQGVLAVRVPYREELKSYLDDTYPYRYAHLRAFDEHSIRLLFERIFHCKVLAWDVAGYHPDAVRLRYKLPKCDGLFLRLISLAKRISPVFHKYLAKTLFRAIEMNVIIKKL